MGSPGTAEADYSGITAPPASFYTDMSRLFDSLVNNGSGNANQGYRRLRFFSGQLSIPALEEEPETWLIQAVEGWSISETVKRQRLSESLLGLAAEVIQKLRMGKKFCVAMDYIDALHAVFGRVETIADLSYKFNHAHQKRGERLSEYISPVDRMLHQIILKKGIMPLF